jgi:hypothetical protein
MTIYKRNTIKFTVVSFILAAVLWWTAACIGLSAIRWLKDQCDDHLTWDISLDYGLTSELFCFNQGAHKK